mgnify:CR=1 FL=1
METLSYCQLMERMLAAEARVVELESRTVTVKIPSTVEPKPFTSFIKIRLIHVLRFFQMRAPKLASSGRLSEISVVRPGWCTAGCEGRTN